MPYCVSLPIFSGRTHCGSRRRQTHHFNLQRQGKTKNDKEKRQPALLVGRVRVNVYVCVCGGSGSRWLRQDFPWCLTFTAHFAAARRRSCLGASQPTCSIRTHERTNTHTHTLTHTSRIDFSFPHYFVVIVVVDNWMSSRKESIMRKNMWFLWIKTWNVEMRFDWVVCAFILQTSASSFAYT